MRIISTVSFEIPGAAVPKARPRARVVTGTSGKVFANMYTPKESVKFENLVKVAYWQKREGPPVQGPVGIRVVAFFPIPASWPKYRKQAAQGEQLPVEKKPDVDNIVKSVCDGLNGVAFADDKQVWCLEVQKRYSPNPRTLVRVDEYSDAVVHTALCLTTTGAA